MRNVKINISIRSHRIETNIICFIIILYDIRIDVLFERRIMKRISFSTNSTNIVQITAYLSIINQQRIFPRFLRLFAIFFFFLFHQLLHIWSISSLFFSSIAMIPSALKERKERKKKFTGRSDILISSINYPMLISMISMSNRWIGNWSNVYFQRGWKIIVYTRIISE